jgi:hypothetical protein
MNEDRRRTKCGENVLNECPKINADIGDLLPSAETGDIAGIDCPHRIFPYISLTRFTAIPERFL